MITLPESKFEKKRLKTIFRQSYVALPGNMAVAFCIAIVFREKIAAPFLIFWLIAITAVLLVRYMVFIRYKSLKDKSVTPKEWFLRYGIVTSACGVMWGIFSVYANYHVSMAYLSIILIIMAGLVAASLATNAVSIPIFLGFSIPTFLPVALALIFSGEFEKILLGALSLFYLLVIYQSALQLNKVILSSLTHRYEKLQLLDDLQELNQLLALDIEKRKQTEKEKEVLIADLQKALNEVKTLSGLIPICARCKKVRDDKGYWNQIESYIHQHSGADFSHSICPDCAKILYPELDPYGSES